jgi:hypothetical protein
VAIDTSGVQDLFHPANAAKVHAALAGRRPVISPQAAREFTHSHPGLTFPLLVWVWMHGGRFSRLEGSKEAILAMNQQKHPNAPKISEEDAAVVANAVAENLDLVTGDKKQFKFVNYAKERGLLSISAHYYHSSQPSPVHR